MKDLNVWVNLKSYKGSCLNQGSINGLPLRPYVALYPWVDQNWVPIKVVGSETIPNVGSD